MGPTFLLWALPDDLVHCSWKGHSHVIGQLGCSGHPVNGAHLIAKHITIAFRHCFIAMYSGRDLYSQKHLTAGRSSDFLFNQTAHIYKKPPSPNNYLTLAIFFVIE